MCVRRVVVSMSPGGLRTSTQALSASSSGLFSAASPDRSIENREGFAGSDGLFRFSSNGAIERGLAIMEVRQNSNAVLEAAPRRFRNSGT